MNKYAKILKDGLLDENPILIQVIGTCPTMAVTTSAQNGLAMGLASTAVLICSNLFVSLLRKFIPDEVRIPIFIVITAAFVTAVEMVIKAFAPALNDSLGIYIPLITVNCIILSRSESFACKNPPLDSMLDGISMGLGFTIALIIMGAIRELLGAGSVFGMVIPFMPKTIMMILTPGGFITLACIIATMKYIRMRRRA
ncbi:MAG: electron transport complex subunit E [Clostridiales bacterium]|jgi:electron transport complex protein RnfE|nr:electron transport complex subunit E [Clostridiales bacterium]